MSGPEFLSSSEFQSHFDDDSRIDASDLDTNITQENIDEMKQIVARYPQPRSALIPMLHYIQSVDGKVSDAGVKIAAELTGITEAQVSGVATFYTQFHRKRAGEHHVGICTTALCAVMGGDILFDQVSKKLGIQNGETTEDGKFSLERLECNAACDFAPVMMVNWEFMDNMTPEKADQILDDLAAGKEVHSTRGPKIVSWKASERVLAGFPDGLADEGPSGGPASLRGINMAREKGWTAPDPNNLPISDAADEEAK